MIAKYILTVLSFSLLLFAQEKSALDLHEISGLSSAIFKVNYETAGTEVDQFRFEIGIRDELFLMFAKVANSDNSGVINTMETGFAPINFHALAGLSFLETYRIYFQYGYSYVFEDFSGYDGGIFFNANFYAGFYGTAGIDFFSKSGSSHGLSTSDKKNFTFYCAGLGYQFSNHFSLDLTYYIPNNKVFGYNVNPYDYEYINKVNKGILKLGFEYIVTL